MVVSERLQTLRPHHRDTIERVLAQFSIEPEVRAIIVGGSVVKNEARDDSDVDVILIVTEEEYARREATSELAFVDRELATAPTGYVDFKRQTLSFLQDAAQCGSEPTRNAFVSALCLWERDDSSEVTRLLPRIARYPEAERQDKINSFMAQLAFNRHYFWREAQRENNAYLMARVQSETVLFGSRLILAHNRVLFPSHKRLKWAIERAPHKPEGFWNLAEAVLADATKENMDAFCDAVEGFTEWNVSVNLMTRFVEDCETSWRCGGAALSDL
ncbi:hypothetical protein IAD21_06257 [Abditibacteriota bacterium]|nr:hypothetical protein IAD21_06257 [Abditibacteriota bacterium]